jgi:cell division protein FtsZ
MQNTRTIILGVGGGAGKVLRSLAKTGGAEWLELAHVDTDTADMEGIEGIKSIPAGISWTQGQGCGGDPVVAEKAVGAGIRELKALLADAAMVVVVGCLGRGTASGGVQIVSRLVREEHIPAFFFVTMPFAIEGNGRREIADVALRDLRENSDLVIAIQNDLLFTTISADTRLNEAFLMADQVLADGVIGIAELIRCRGMMSVDFASLRALLKNREADCSFGIGRASGADKTTTVVDEVFKSPMLGDRDFVNQSDVVVASLIGGNDLAIGEITQCLSALTKQLDSKTKAYVGANVVEERSNDLQLTLIAVHYKHKPEPEPEPKRRRVTRGKRKAKDAVEEKQYDLPFVEAMVSAGIFANVAATIREGENLDTPVFQRQGVVLDLNN